MPHSLCACQLVLKKENNKFVHLCHCSRPTACRILAKKSHARKHCYQASLQHFACLPTAGSRSSFSSRDAARWSTDAISDSPTVQDQLQSRVTCHAKSGSVAFRSLCPFLCIPVLARHLKSSLSSEGFPQSHWTGFSASPLSPLVLTATCPDPLVPGRDTHPLHLILDNDSSLL